MARRTFRGSDALFSYRPLTWRELPTVLAILALIPFGFAAIMDFSLERHGFHDQTTKGPTAIAAVCAGWLLLFGIAEWSRRWRRDPVLDVISWLLPSRPVFEVRGTHFQITGWLNSGKSPQARILVLAQNCHRGERELTITLLPRNPRGLGTSEPVVLEISLKDSGVMLAFETRPLALREGAMEFDLQVRVRIKTLGWRTRLRRGISPKSKWLEPAQMLIHAHNPVFMVAHLATARRNPEQAPLTLAAQETPEPHPWPAEKVVPVWGPKSGWVLGGPARDWMGQWSESLARAISSGARLPMRDGEGL
jgi:hypothetical protein